MFLEGEFWKTKYVSELSKHSFLTYQNIVLDDRVPLSTQEEFLKLNMSVSLIKWIEHIDTSQKKMDS